VLSETLLEIEFRLEANVLKFRISGTLKSWQCEELDELEWGRGDCRGLTC